MTAKSLHQVLSIGISFRQNASSGPGDLQWGLGLISDERAAMLFLWWCSVVRVVLHCPLHVVSASQEQTWGKRHHDTLAELSAWSHLRPPLSGTPWWEVLSSTTVTGALLLFISGDNLLDSQCVSSLFHEWSVVIIKEISGRSQIPSVSLTAEYVGVGNTIDDTHKISMVSRVWGVLGEFLQ